MKTHLLLASLLYALLSSCSTKAGVKTDASLYQLFEKKQFVRLEQANSNPDDPLFHFYKAVFANVSNKPKLANEYLDNISSQNNVILNSIYLQILRLKNDNYVKLFDYKNAFKTSEELTEKYASHFSDEELADERSAMNIWKALDGQKPQTILPFEQATVPLSYDMAKLMNVNVESGGQKMDFVFDTGAGLSSIMESVARDMDFVFMKDYGAQVKGTGEVYNDVKVAIAKEITINEIVIQNVPFIVFKDEVFTFAEGLYKIHGIIGFPVAKELGTLTISADKMLVSREKQNVALVDKNLFFEMLHPILFLKYQDKNLPCIFDTGADHTIFSSLFYNQFGKELLPKGEVVQAGVAGAGGSMRYKALALDSIEMSLGNQKVGFSDISIQMENSIIQGEAFYGNIGQDLLRQYPSVVMSFDYNYLKLLK